MVDIIQDDREAAADLIEWHNTAASEWHTEGGADLRFFAQDMPEGVRKGIWDEHEFVQAFARHRLAQNDAQMAAPDALPHHAQRYLAYMCAFHLARSGQFGVSLQSEAAADSIHTIMDTLPNEILDLDFDIPAFGGCDGPWKCFHCGFLAETREEAEQHFGKTEDEAATCLASLSASNVMRDALERMLQHPSGHPGGCTIYKGVSHGCSCGHSAAVENAKTVLAATIVECVGCGENISGKQYQTDGDGVTGCPACFTENGSGQCHRSMQEPASNAMRDALESLLKHYVDMVESGDCGFWDAEAEDVVKAARAALAGQGTTLDRQTVERVLEPDDLLPSYCRLLDAMQGDDPDAVDSAFHASIEAVSKFGLLRASMDPNHVR